MTTLKMRRNKPYSDALGAAMTLSLALTALPFGLALGLGAALAKDSKSAWLRALGEAYTTVFSGLPPGAIANLRFP
jgi:ABC-type arginine transport system permease subunit